MAYSIAFNVNEINFDSIHIKRQDGIWKDSPYFVCGKSFVKHLEEVKDFEVHSDDIWLLGYFKTGSTMTKELIWLLNNDLNFEKAKSELLSDRFRYFEKFTIDSINISGLYDTICNSPRPRYFKSHLPASLLPQQIWEKKPKIIHVSRNPKDVAVSFHHWLKLMFPYKKTLEETLDTFLKNEAYYGPYIDHNLMYWELEKQGYPNILYLTFEEMIQDYDSVVQKTQDFLGKSYSKQQIELLKDHLSFDKMKKNNAVNHSEKVLKDVKDRTSFMRKGKIGSYKDEMSVEYIKKFDEWIETSLKDKEHRFNLI